ncbi:OmpW family outer membrane protein [Echinicola sp. 20G]|uniref:OmpW family outer membrane protein n=1 Tax=Echinicola sp. 20G TaxID=2781961 RepID=UPI001910EF6E|nr:OmpW family outer membrane protein [Echinicola sp. 20G]
MKLKILLIAILTIVGLNTVNAQQGYSEFQLNYLPSLPLGETKDFTSKFSFRGLGIEYNYYIQDHLSIGLATGIVTYYEASDGIQSLTVVEDGNNVTLSAKQYNYTNVVPILANGTYYLQPSGQVQPYIGLGIGGYYVMRWVEMGLYQVKDDKMQFGVAPKVGVMAPLSYGLALNLGLQYNSAFGDQPFNSLDFKIGLAWKY